MGLTVVKVWKVVLLSNLCLCQSPPPGAMALTTLMYNSTPIHKVSVIQTICKDNLNPGKAHLWFSPVMGYNVMVCFVFPALPLSPLPRFLSFNFIICVSSSDQPFTVLPCLALALCMNSLYLPLFVLWLSFPLGCLVCFCHDWITLVTVSVSSRFSVSPSRSVNHLQLLSLFISWMFLILV